MSLLCVVHGTETATTKAKKSDAVKAKELLHCALKPMKVNQIDYVRVEPLLHNTYKQEEV